MEGCGSCVDNQAAYTGHGSDYQELKRANVQLLRNAVSVVEKSCPKVKLWTLQTGGKWYGVEFPGQIEFSVPFKESSPRIPSPYAENIFYYAQHDLLEDLSKGKPWTFTEIRPDAIIGFVPNNNAMNLAQCLGLFLALYRSVEGQDATVPYPGGDEEYESVHSDTSQDILARFTIFASLHPDKTSRRAFNVADGADVTWQSVWRGICEYFDLKGVGPDPSRTTGAKWVMDHENEWTEWYQQHDLKRGTLEGTTWDFMEAIFGINFNRQYDLSAARNIGFIEEVDTIAGYYKAFDRMKEAKLIPRSFT
ncbi:MAG: hypothetical protein M1825_005279 [Sarcosagium campestre]|nr:MAG: hypothetical protein M1825_005279 [Sarcosagium campestre]